MIEKESIYLKQMIIHILDSTVGMPVLSDTELESGSDFGDFVREHIYRLLSGDDVKTCHFHQEESPVYEQLTTLTKENFISVSQEIAQHLFTIMNQNIDIPPADFLVCSFVASETP